MMYIKIIAYAQMSDFFPKEQEIHWEAKSQITLLELKQKLVELNPKVKEFLPSLRFAKKDAFLPPEAVLKNGDTIDLIPPSSGG